MSGKRAMLLVLLFAHLAHAADDAPVVTPLVPGFVCVPESRRVLEGKAMASCEARNDSLTHGNVIVSTPIAIATLGGAVVLAIAAGIAIGVAVKKP